MKRLVALFALAIVALSSLATLAVTPGEPLPPGATWSKVWQWNGTAWVDTEYAQSWNSLAEGLASSTEGKSNKEIHTFEIINHISVAQWVEFSTSATRKDWRILRPGTYAADSITLTLKSNNAVVIEFWAEDPEYTVEEAGVTRTIPKWFSIGGDTPDTVTDWLRATETSKELPFTYTVEDSAALHNGYSVKLWEKIQVVPSNSSSDYEGKGYLTIKLTNIKHWVDPETGTFRDPQT